MNRLRSHREDKRAQEAQRRLQSDIVRDLREDIVELIAHDGATLSEVADAVRAVGEPVLDHGFRAEILKQIGRVKDIRSGRAKAAAAPTPAPAPATQGVVQAPIRAESIEDVAEDDDDLFAARRPRR